MSVVYITPGECQAFYQNRKALSYMTGRMSNDCQLLRSQKSVEQLRVQISYFF
jgi:hypothetical protein